MATRLKLFVTLLVVFCILQLVHMAPEQRVRREENADQSKIDAALKTAQEGFQKFLNDENTKKFIDAATNAFSDITKGLEHQFNDLKDKLDSGKTTN